MKLINKILGIVCFFCPLCIIKRKFKESKFAKIMNKLESKCIFCNAFDKAYK